MHIGINGLFLRKPGTGIGSVTQGFLRALARHSEDHSYTIYVDDMSSLEQIVAPHIQYRYIRPWWQRDDLIRKLVWEYVQLPWAVESDFIKHFLSLYQSPSRFSKKIQHTMVVHDVIPEIFPEYLGTGRQRLLWQFTRQAIVHAQNLVAVSESTKKDIIKYFGVAEKNITVAYPSVSQHFFTETMTENVYALPRGYIYVGGGLEKRKNIIGLLDAYQALCQEDPVLPPLVLSGLLHNKNNALATNVPEEIEKRKLGSQVRFLGFVPAEHLPGLYHDAALFVFPSLYEGFGLPMLESLAIGTPVMALKNSSLPEVGGEQVFWVEAITKESLRDTLQKITAVEAHDLTQQRGHRRAWAQQFTWERFATKIIQVTTEV
jgi:glycosyltransferase involved in cell wall biosynthesis